MTHENLDDREHTNGNREFLHALPLYSTSGLGVQYYAFQHCSTTSSPLAGSVFGSSWSLFGGKPVSSRVSRIWLQPEVMTACCSLALSLSLSLFLYLCLPQIRISVSCLGLTLALVASPSPRCWESSPFSFSFPGNGSTAMKRRLGRQSLQKMRGFTESRVERV